MIPSADLFARKPMWYDEYRDKPVAPVVLDGVTLLKLRKLKEDSRD